MVTLRFPGLSQGRPPPCPAHTQHHGHSWHCDQTWNTAALGVRGDVCCRHGCPGTAWPMGCLLTHYSQCGSPPNNPVGLAPESGVTPVLGWSAATHLRHVTFKPGRGCCSYWSCWGGGRQHPREGMPCTRHEILSCVTSVTCFFVVEQRWSALAGCDHGEPGGTVLGHFASWREGVGT